jgi:CheY-like chemotaxis protein
MTAAEHAAGAPALGETVPPQGVPVGASSGRRARRNAEPAALPAGGSGQAGASDASQAGQNVPAGRRARRALGSAPEREAEQSTARTVFALPPAEADRTTPEPDAATVADTDATTATGRGADGERHDAAQGHPSDGHTPPQPHPVQTVPAARAALPQENGARPRAAQPLPAEAPSADPNSTQGRAISVRTLGQGVPFGRQIAEQQRPPRPQPAAPGTVQPLPSPQPNSPAAAQPNRANQPSQANPANPVAGKQPGPQARQASGTQGGGQGPSGPKSGQQPVQSAGGNPSLQVPLPPQVPQPAAALQEQTQHTLGGSGRRRRLSTRPDPAGTQPETAARPHPQAPSPTQPKAQPQTPSGQSQPGQPQSLLSSSSEGRGRSYAIGAPDQDADEGPEPLDGPGGAVELAVRPQPQPMDDELPPEPLDNPRRLLVWPAPDATTQQALSDRGYRPVTVHSREEVDAQIAAFPAALFVDPLTGPITRTALQSLRQAAVAAEVPVLVTAGLGQATREAAYGADPAVLLKALAPRDSEQHPSRVLLIEEREEIALALTATLERRGMQVARAGSDADAVTLAAQMRPNLVVMDLLQVRRRRAGIVDWLRANGQLNRTPLVVYTAAVEEAELPRLAAGETVLFLAERSTSDEVQGRIVDLLAKIGTN